MNQRWVFLCALQFGLLGPVSAQDTKTGRAAGADRLADQVAPLLLSRCAECHSGAEPKGELDLTLAPAEKRTGDGRRLLQPGEPARSALWQRIAADEMPPEHPLAAAERELIYRWIEAGAPWPVAGLDPFAFSSTTRAGFDWWSLQPLRSTVPPRGFDETSTITTSDAEPLDKSAPFAGDNPLDAFVRSSRRAQQLPASRPADRQTFIRRVTFDLLGIPPTPAEIEAFVRDSQPLAYEYLVDRLLASPHYGERWARHWLDVVRFGESHGFEYNEPRNNAWPYRNWVIEAFNRDLPYDEFVRWQLAGDVLHPDDPGAVAATGFLVAGPHNTTKPAVQNMRDTMRHDELEDIVGAIGQTFLGLTANCARCHDHKFDPISQREYYQLVASIVGFDHGERPLPKSSVTDEEIVYTAVSQPAPTVHVLSRGDVTRPGAEVVPAGLRGVAGVSSDFNLAAEAPDGERRLALARWVTDGGNSLFARVIVNRIWHYHFGRGFVPTTNDLGFNGGYPSHPELLEWLAQELRSSGWSLKRLQRLIVLSDTYRQASHYDPQAWQQDAGNRWLWRMTPRRLEAEELRDAMLCVAGCWNREMGGVGYRDLREYKYLGSHYYDPLDPDTRDPERLRRTIYRFSPRGAKRTMLDTFDCPDPSTKTPVRESTITPVQALSLLNNEFVLRMAEEFAGRLAREQEQVADQVERAYQLAYGRSPQEDEMDAAAEFIKTEGLVPFCRAILNSNEFLFVR